MDIIVLGVLEFNSIAVGIKALDGVVKAASVKVIDARTICPGKFVILFTGEVAAVDASLTAGKEIGEGYIVDELFIPNLHSQIIPAIIGTVECKIWDAVAVVESFSVVAQVTPNFSETPAAEIKALLALILFITSIPSGLSNIRVLLWK